MWKVKQFEDGVGCIQTFKKVALAAHSGVHGSDAMETGRRTVGLNGFGRLINL